MKRSPFAFTWRNGWLPGRKMAPPVRSSVNSKPSGRMARFQIMHAPPASSSAPAHSAMRMPSPVSVVALVRPHHFELPGHKSLSISVLAP